MEYFHNGPLQAYILYQTGYAGKSPLRSVVAQSVEATALEAEVCGFETYLRQLFSRSLFLYFIIFPIMILAGISVEVCISLI